MEALRDLADDFNVRDPRKLYRLARQRDLDVTQAMAFEALTGAPATRAGQVGRRGAERPAAGRPHRLQPEHAGEDEVRPGGDGRLHPGGRRGTSAEQERRDGGPGHQARRAGADGGRQELCGHDRPGQQVRHAGPGAARSRAPHEAARGPQRHCRGGPGHPDAEEGGWRARAGSGATTLSGRPGPTTRGPTRRCTARPRTWRSSRPQSSGPPRQRRQVPAQQGPHRPARPADETGQAGCETAGRLPGASEAQDPRLAFLDIARAGGEFPEPAQALFGLGAGVGKPCKTVQKSYYSSPYIYVRTGVIAFCGAKPCETSYSYRPYMHVHPGRIALCGPKPCKCPFRVWGPRQTKRVGRTIEKRNPPGTLGRPVLKKKSETPPDPLGEPLKNETPPGPVGRTIEKKIPKLLPGPLGGPLKKNPKPLPGPLGEPLKKTDPYPADPLGGPLKKNPKPLPGPLGEPLKKNRPLPRRPVGRTIEKKPTPTPQTRWADH